MRLQLTLFVCFAELTSESETNKSENETKTKTESERTTVEVRRQTECVCVLTRVSCQKCLAKTQTNRQTNVKLMTLESCVWI